MTPEAFLWKIGNNCKEYAEKFETLEEVIKSTRVNKKKMIKLIFTRMIVTITINNRIIICILDKGKKQ